MVSIITPVYNTEKYLQQFIHSVLAQSYKDLELLLIDDGSTDNSLEICNKYAGLDGRIKVFHLNHGGVAKARNLGLSNAIGNYVMFADSDDYLTPDALEVTVDLITRTNADIVQANWYKNIDGVIKFSKRLMKSRQYDNKKAVSAFLNLRLLGGYIYSKLYRAEILCKIKFPVDMSLGEDSIFAFQAFLNASKVVYTSTPIYYYRIRQDSLSMHGNANFCDRDLDVFKQIDYIHKSLENNGKDIIHKNRENIFQFNLCLSALYRYLKSDDDTQIIYHEVGKRLKASCDELWIKTFFMTINPRIKIRALEYGIKKRFRSR